MFPLLTFTVFVLFVASHVINAAATSTGSISIRMDETLIEYMQALDIDSSATTSEIKSAYRRLAKEKHPDVSALPKDQAEAQFKHLGKMYEYLMNNYGEMVRTNYRKPVPKKVYDPKIPRIYRVIDARRVTAKIIVPHDACVNEPLLVYCMHGAHEFRFELERGTLFPIKIVIDTNIDRRQIRLEIDREDENQRF
jgi:hypothetical protein